MPLIYLRRWWSALWVNAISGFTRLRYGWPPKPKAVRFNLQERGIVHCPVYYVGRCGAEKLHLWFAITPVPLNELRGLEDMDIGVLPARTSLSIVNRTHFTSHRDIIKTIMTNTIMNRVPAHERKGDKWKCTGCGVVSPDPCNCNCHTRKGI
jgi:hypothetical protein